MDDFFFGAPCICKLGGGGTKHCAITEERGYDFLSQGQGDGTKHIVFFWHGVRNISSFNKENTPTGYAG